MKTQITILLEAHCICFLVSGFDLDQVTISGWFLGL